MKCLSQLILSGDCLSSTVGDGVEVTSIAYQSSSVKAGSLFFAIRGHVHDGHEHIGEALAKGAVGAVVEDPEVHANTPNSILVSSVRRQLALSASRWFDSPSSKLCVVAVTGTNGKTTTTYLLSQIWEKLGLKIGRIGTIGYVIGSKQYEGSLTTPGPLELQQILATMVSEGVTHVAMEASNIALDQFRVEGTDFNHAVFTNLTQDHLDYHGDFESYFQAKRRLFTDFDLTSAVFNLDDSWGKKLFDEFSGTTFSLEDSSATVFAKRFDLGRSGLEAEVFVDGRPFKLKSPLMGNFNLQNIFAAVAVCRDMGLSLDEVFKALPYCNGAPGRLERVVNDTTKPVVFVDYAHTDDALKNVLLSVKQLSGVMGGRVITVFGCGGDRDRGKRPKMAAVASQFSDVTLATSDNPRTEDPEAILNDVESGIDMNATQYIRQSDRCAAIHQALSIAQPNDIVLIAGKGHETYQIIGTTKSPFDDKQVVLEFYQ